MTEGFGVPCGMVSSLPPLLPTSSGLTDLGFLKGSIHFLESSLEMHVVFTISRKKYVPMPQSAGRALNLKSS